MEGSPSAVENNSEEDKDEERKARLKKPEHLGILAMEPAEKEPEQSPLERVLAAIRGPKEEAAEKPPKQAVEEEPAAVPEAPAPVERSPEPVVVEREPEPAPEPEADPEPRIEEQVEAEPEPPVEREPEPVEAPAAEAPLKEPPAPTETQTASPAAEEEPAPKLEEVPSITPEAVPEPEPEAEPASEPEAERPAPVEQPVEVPPEEPAESAPAEKEDNKKRKGLRGLFSRGNKKEKEPEPALEPETAPEPPVEKKAEGPKFQFKEKTEEPPAEAIEVPSEPEEHEAPRKVEAKPERIGQMALNPEGIAEPTVRPTAEAAESSKAAEEKMHVESSSPIEPVSGKHVDTMSRVELMELGARIEVNGSNLRHIYETHLIGERGLRRLIAEYLQGGDVAKALRREVMEHEIDFERDPAMRDHVLTAAEIFDSDHLSLDKLLEKADVSLADNSEQTAVFQAQARHEAASQQRQSHQFRLLDIALVGTISFLVLLIIIIFIAQR